MEVILDLRNLTADLLQPLLDEEIEAWRAMFDWDFRTPSLLVRRLVETRTLTGFAAIRGGRVVGYTYYVAQEGKGLIGDFFVRAPDRDPAVEIRLLKAVLDALLSIPGTRRIEGQLMMLQAALPNGAPHSQWLRRYPREFLETPLSPPFPVRECPGIEFAPWTENHADAITQLIHLAYDGHIDCQMNDQYRSLAGAHQYVNSIVAFFGCGNFAPQASFVALSREADGLAGFSLASVVAEKVGHIPQICVAPQHQGKGIGYELMRRSLTALAAQGCSKASLSVTASNKPAIELYGRLGFQPRHHLTAYVWEIS